MTEHRTRSRLEPGARRQFIALLVSLLWPIALLAAIAMLLWLMP